MHNAPSVSYPVGRCALAHRLVIVLAALSMAVWAAWVVLQGWQALTLLSGALWVFAGVGAWRSLQAQAGTLTWDGQVWCWHGVAYASDALGQIRVQWDVQNALLLHWLPSDVSQGNRGVNLWLSAQTSPEVWQDLRRAVYAHDNR